MMPSPPLTARPVTVPISCLSTTAFLKSEGAPPDRLRDTGAILGNALGPSDGPLEGTRHASDTHSLPPIGRAERTLSEMNSLTERDVAEVLRMKVTTLRAWRLKGRGPKFVKFGSAVRYLASDVAAYVEACRATAEKARA